MGDRDTEKLISVFKKDIISDFRSGNEVDCNGWAGLVLDGL